MRDRVGGADPGSVRARIRRWLGRPSTEAAVVTLVLASVALLSIELSLPLDDVRAVWVAGAGDAITGLFVVELALRFWVARSKATFFRRYWVDLIAVLPFARPARLFRVLRVLRLLRAGVLLNRRLRWAQTPRVDGARQFAVLASLALAAVVAGTFVMVVSEPTGPLHEPGGALWYSVGVLISGEPLGGEPATVGGRVATLALMFSGLSFFGVFVGTVSAAMTARLDEGWKMSASDFAELHGHVVICGWNRSGGTMLRELVALGRQDVEIVLVTEGPQPADLPFDVLDPQRFFHHQGDWTRVDVLTHVHVVAASMAILLTDESQPRADQDRDARTVLAALTIEKMAPDIYTVAEVISPDTATHLEHSHVEEVIVGDWYAGMILGAAAGAPGLVAVLDEVLTAVHGNGFHLVDVPPSWVGRTVREVRHELHDLHEATLVSLHQDGAKQVNPPGGATLGAGGTLVLLARHRPDLGR